MFKLDHDYHIHTNLSTCSKDPQMTANNIVQSSIEQGYNEIVITNHFWDEKIPGADEWYAPQNLYHLKKVLPLPEAQGMRVHFGCETEFCGGTKIGISPESYDAFEFIIVPFNHLHNNFSRPVDCVTTAQVAQLYVEHFEQLLVLSLPWTKVGIAHLTVPLTYPGEKLYEVIEQLDPIRMRECFRKICEMGAGVELNAACFKQGWHAHKEVFLSVYSMAKEEGCKFYCGSDAHNITDMPRLKENLKEVIDILRLSDSDRFRI